MWLFEEMLKNLTTVHILTGEFRPVPIFCLDLLTFSLLLIIHCLFSLDIIVSICKEANQLFLLQSTGVMKLWETSDATCIYAPIDLFMSPFFFFFRFPQIFKACWSPSAQIHHEPYNPWTTSTHTNTHESCCHPQFSFLEHFLPLIHNVMAHPSGSSSLSGDGFLP